MQDHTVTIDGPGDPPAIQTSDIFNVAVPFIDRHLTEGRGEKTAISTAHENVTYSQLAERVNRWGNALKGLGVKPAERVLMVVRDCPEFFYLFFGAIKAGVIPAPVNTMLRAPDYKFMIEDSGCKALIYTPELAEVVEGGLGLADHQPAIILKATGPGSIAEPMAQASTDLEPAPTRLEDDCFWLYSSGSTGNPKGVVHAHRVMVYTSQCSGVDTIGLMESDSCFSASKLFHSYGFGNAMTFPLWVGATMILSDRRVTPDMSFEMMEQFKPTVFFGVPTLYAQQLQAMEKSSPDLSSLRRCVSAGEALPGDVFLRWRKRPAPSFWTALARPRHCISLSATPRLITSRARRAGWCPAMRCASWAMTERWLNRAKSAPCMSKAAPRPSNIGTIRKKRKTPCWAIGSIRGTCITRTRKVISSIAGAATI